MVINSTNINKTNNHLPYMIIHRQRFAQLYGNRNLVPELWKKI